MAETDLRYALKLWFGKYAECTLREVANIDPGYIVWLATIKPDLVPEELLDACVEAYDDEEDLWYGLGPDDFD